MIAMNTGYKVGDAMTQSPITISPEASVKDCAKKMTEVKVESLVVKKGKELVGIITDIDLVEKVVAKGLSTDGTKVRNVMVSKLITITPEKDIYEAILLMKKRDIRQLPVVSPKDKKILLGYVTMKDILKIEPSLFDMIVQEFELREENRKLSKAGPREGICQTCGKYAEELSRIDDVLMCEHCKEE